MKSSKLRPWSLRPGGIDSGSIDSGSIDSGSIDSGSIDSGSIETDYRVPSFSLKQRTLLGPWFYPVTPIGAL